MSDFIVAFRALIRDRRFSIVAILTLSTSIGAGSALFALYDRLILHPVTIDKPETLIAILNSNPQLNAPVAAVSYPRYEHLRDHAQSFASIGVSAFDNFTLTGNGDPNQLNALRVSSSFLPTLGVPLARGRNFTPQEDQQNGPAVCIISYEFWQSQFGGRESIVGDTITLNAQPWQVVGVTPPRLSPPFAQVQLMAPRVFEVTGLTLPQVQNGAGYAQPIARLNPGVSMQQATTELQALSQSYRNEFSTRLDAQNVSVPQPFVTFLVGGLEPTFYALLGAVGFVLLIACANIASLFLGRLMTRHKEIAVRQSLGAMRGRIVRQFLIESLVFSTVAGGAGLLLGTWALRAVQSLLASQLPPNASLTMTTGAVLFTIGITLVSAILVGLTPAWQASRADLVDALNDQTRGSSGRRGATFRSVLIVVEVALSLVLLVCSAMLLLSFVRLQKTSPGFDPNGLAFAFVGVPATRYATPARQADFYDQVLERLRADGRVTGAATAIGLPMSGFNPRSPYSVEGRQILPLPQRPLAGLAIVSPDYFRMLGVRLTTGRGFTDADREGAPNVCVINQSLARRLFPAESPLGHALLRGKDADVRVEIVGVIEDVKTLGLNTPPPDEIYFPMRQLGRPAMAIAVKTTGDPSQMQSVLRSAVAQIDRDQPISFFATMDATIAQSLGVQRIVASLTGVFAALALALATVGLYSVIAYAVSQRTTEIGIRMALGARPGQVVGLVMRNGMLLVGAGVVCGIAASAGVAQLIRTLLYQVQPLDPGVYGIATAIFVTVALLACLLPSRRASRIDPLLALRR